MGAVLAMYIQTTASGGLIHSQVGKWCFIGAIALAGAICTLLLAKPLLIILTSIAGAYAAMIGAVPPFFSFLIFFRTHMNTMTAHQKESTHTQKKNTAVDTWNGGQLSQAFRDVFNRRDADNIVHLSQSSQILLGVAAALAVCGMLAQFLVTARYYHHDPDKRKKLHKKRKKRSSGK